MFVTFYKFNVQLMNFIVIFYDMSCSDFDAICEKSK